MPDTIQKKIYALQEIFVKNIPQKISEIENAWHHVKKDYDEEKMILLHRLVHNLKGSAGTYGHQSLSNKASQLKNELETITKKPGKLAIKRVEKEMAILAKTADKATLQLQQFSSYKTRSLPASNKVYLLDKDKNFSTILQKQLDPFDYDLSHYEKVKDLQAALEQEMPFAVIIEFNFLNSALTPELIKCIKVATDHSGLVLVVASDGDFNKYLSAVRAGSNGYLIKPFSIEELIDKFDHHINIIKSEYTILIVEDSLEVAEYYSLLLQKAGMYAYILSNPMQIDKALVDYNPDLVLMDMYMPGCNGLELAAIIRQQEIHASMPIVFLSSEEDKKKQLKAMSLGVDDFISKSTKPEYVIYAIKNRAKRYQLLNSLIVKDGLTGVYNHTNIQKRLGETLKAASRLGTPVAVAMIDLDHFKEVNDMRGHQFGDKVLKNLCLLLRKRLRETDIIGRYGGEEFLVIFPHTNATAAQEILSGIQKQFNDLVYSEASSVSVNFSAGISAYPAYQTTAMLIQKADEALYKAKETGRNKVLLADIK